MTWRHALCALAALALPATAAPAAAPTAAGDAQEGEEFMPLTQIVALDESDPETGAVGELIYRGGVSIEPDTPNIGGISGLEWHDDALWAVSDDGRWMRLELDEDSAQLRDIYGLSIGRLHDLKGKALKAKGDADAEAITRSPDGGWLVAFEQDHRIWRYADLAGEALPGGEGPLATLTPADANRGLETLAAFPGGLLACVESHAPAAPDCVRLTGSAAQGIALDLPPALAEHGGAPTDAACADDATCYILIRSYQAGYGNRAAIIELALDNAQRTLAVLDAPLTRDNFEGIAVREQYGKRYLYLASDDNFNNCAASERTNCQRTLLMKFEINQPDAPPPPIADAPEPDPQFETLAVVLETQAGDITIALETERAPITAANFLRYVDEGRLDGTVFYRAMSLDREPRPNGLLQGGTQFDPKRILPPIPHEPTSTTGLSHTHGALSMAMGEPGSATGDFSIMLQDQTGLDADPAATDPVWRNGYAVFGTVTDGMEVVAAIHAGAIDPDKGEGWMKGQMLREPVTILKARRAPASDE